MKKEITSNREATERLEQEVKTLNKTIATHELDIQVLKRAIV